MDLLEEFYTLNWRNPNILYDNEPSIPFIPNTEIERSHIFTDLIDEIPKEMSPNVPPKKNQSKKKKIDANKNNSDRNAIQTSAPESFLTKFEQEACLKGLQMMQRLFDSQKLTLKNKQYLSKYNQNRECIIRENSQFLFHAQNQWTPQYQRKCFQVNAKVLEAFKNVWASKLEEVLNYPRYYSSCATLPLTFDDADHVKMCLEENILQAESCAQISEHTICNGLSLKAFEKGIFKLSKSNGKHSASDDRVALEIVQQSNIDAVISSSSLKKLINNHGPDYSAPWEIPVVIRKENVTGNHLNKTIIYINKPFVPKQLNSHRIKENCYKKCLQKLICQQLRAQNMNTSSENEDVSVGVNQNNVTYNVWKMSLYDEKNELMKNKHKKEEFRILVRCKIDAFETSDNGTACPISIFPKLEYQIHLGGNIPTLNELSNQWASLFFRPNAALYRVRINSVTSTIELCERNRIEKVVNDSLKCYNFKPMSKLGILYRLISELKTLKPGNYVISHSAKQGAFLSVMKETVVETAGPLIYDLHSSYGKEKCQLNENEEIPWCPIDVNLITPKHLKNNVMPGMFKPCLRKKGTKQMGDYKNNRKMKKKKQPKKINIKTRST